MLRHGLNWWTRNWAWGRSYGGLTDSCMLLDGTTGGRVVYWSCLPSVSQHCQSSIPVGIRHCKPSHEYPIFSLLLPFRWKRRRHLTGFGRFKGRALSLMLI